MRDSQSTVHHDDHQIVQYTSCHEYGYVLHGCLRGIQEIGEYREEESIGRVSYEEREAPIISLCKNLIYNIGS